ncbi:MAG: threonine--tRNA ligase, partial [Candidatus Omnitrophica bacterium]|nr:threonine--tRNA ligase [Candidatus Omnitrophota bacterium]
MKTQHSHATTTKNSLEPLRHSAAHILAQAVRRIWPNARLGIGPPIEEGFYYDIEMPQPIAEDDLPRIEAEMRKIISENHAFKQSFKPKAAALEEMKKQEDRFKAEIVEGLADPEVSFFTDGEFVDLCKGPHVA